MRECEVAAGDENRIGFGATCVALCRRDRKVQASPWPRRRLFRRDHECLFCLLCIEPLDWLVPLCSVGGWDS